MFEMLLLLRSMWDGRVWGRADGVVDIQDGFAASDGGVAMKRSARARAQNAHAVDAPTALFWRDRGLPCTLVAKHGDHLHALRKSGDRSCRL